MSKNIVLIYGPQGSGKSTQAKQLAEYLGYKFISSGQTLRELKDAKNPIEERLSSYWIKGDLVPDDLIEEILFPIIEKSDTPGFVIDGYPRTPSQLNSFLSFINMNDFTLDRAVYLDVSQEECLKRLKIRADIENRLDETDEAITTRIIIYFEKTQPLLNVYKNMNILEDIDGERTIEEIQADIRSRFQLTSE